MAEPSSPTSSLAAADGSLAAADGILAFSSEAEDGAGDIFVVDLAATSGARQRLTTSPEREFDPDVSPDGRWLAYRVNPDPRSDAADIWTMARDGTGARNLTGNAALDNWSPAWSPDGRRIAFASTRDGGTVSLWTMAPDGTDLRRVTDGHGEYPDWSPDGRRIAYAAPVGGSGAYEIWTIDAAGDGPPSRVTDLPGTAFAPAWSPDGSWIAFQLDRDVAWELWIVRPDGSDGHRVSPPGEDGVWPTWTASGLLVWSGTHGLAIGDVATGAQRSLALSEPGSEFLSWGPAGPE